MRATEPSTSETAFKAWKAEVSTLCAQRFALSLDDLPDMLTRDAFDAGTTPEEFFEEDVMQMMREDFGRLVDEL